MEVLVPLAKTAVYLMMALTALAAIGVVLLGNIFYAALCLTAVLIGTAGIFIVLHADFLAVVQILIYVGAVMTLVIFAVMLTQRLSEKTVTQHNQLLIPGLLTTAFFFFVLSKAVLLTPWQIRPETMALPPTVSELGQAFMQTYIFPFEIISVILIAALVGAIVIAKKDK